MNSRTRATVLLAMSIALVTIGTMVIRIGIPATNGYMNLGDSIIFTVAIALGRRYGAVAGGLGSALADVLGGFPAWSPWTLVIKGVEGYVAGALGDMAATPSTKGSVTGVIIAATAAGAWMVAGYFAAGSILYGFAGALGELPFNLVQAGGSIVVAAALAPAVRRVFRF
jgi:uncharacterized membrane protein